MTDGILDNNQMADVARRYIEAVTSHDLDGVSALFAADAVQEDPVGHEPHVGIDAIREFFKVGFVADIRGELAGSVLCAPNAIAFPLAVTFKAGDSTLKLEAIDVFEFNEEGKIQSMKAYWGAENCREV